MISDLGYLPQGAEESEVLFTLIVERYERRSPGIMSNLVFSEWQKVLAIPMATRVGDRHDRPPLRNLGVQHPELQDQCSPESSDRQGIRPARIVDAPVKMVDVAQANLYADLELSFEPWG